MIRLDCKYTKNEIFDPRASFHTSMVRRQPNHPFGMSSSNPELIVNISQTFDFKQNTLEETLIWRGRNEPLETTSTTLARYGEVTSDNNQQPPSLRTRPELLLVYIGIVLWSLSIPPIAGLYQRHRPATTTCAQASAKRLANNFNSNDTVPTHTACSLTD